MNNKKTIIGLILILILSLSIFALPEIDAKYIYINKYYKIHKDGSWSLTYDSKIKLNSYLATRRLFGETFINYNKKYQTLKILKSVTIMANGKKVTTPDNGYNEILPYRAHGFPDFTNIRQMVVSHTGLEREAIEELSYIIKSNKNFSNVFSSAEPLTKNIPIDNMTIVFETPINMRFNYKILNSDITPTTVNNGKSVKHIFKIKNIKKTKHRTLYYITDSPYLFVSSGKNYESVKLLFDKQILPDKTIKKIKKLKSKSFDNFDFLLKIQKYVVEDIQTANLGIDDTGIHLRNIEKIINSYYATPLEKASLLYTILKYCKFKPEIIVSTPVKNFYTLTPLDKLFIKIRRKGNIYYINPDKLQSEFYLYNLSNPYVYNINQQKYEKIDQKGYKDNYIKISGKIYLCPKKKNYLIIKTKGYFNDYRRLLNDELSFVNFILSKTIGIRAKKIKKINLKTPEEFSAKIETKGEFFNKKYERYYFLRNFSIPEVSTIKTSFFYNDFPYHFKTEFKIKYDFDIIIPEHTFASYLKNNIKIQNKTGEYLRKITREKENKIHLTIILKILKTKVENKSLLKNLYDNIRKDKNILILTYKK